MTHTPDVTSCNITVYNINYTQTQTHQMFRQVCNLRPIVRQEKVWGCARVCAPANVISADAQNRLALLCSTPTNQQHKINTIYNNNTNNTPQHATRMTVLIEISPALAKRNPNTLREWETRGWALCAALRLCLLPADRRFGKQRMQIYRRLS